MSLPKKEDLVERIGKSVDYWDEQCAARKIPHLRIGRDIYFTEDHIAEIIAMHEVDVSSVKVPTRDEIARKRAERFRRAA